MEATRKSHATRGRQPGLFHLENPLTGRLGTEFFLKLPRQPGVYFFYDEKDLLLYIGQSSDLRARLGSYRHVTPDRHPRRTLRLVARVRRIEWEACATAAEAVGRERVLLLERRPPFNRAGVWVGAPWWLVQETAPGALLLELRREEEGIGPLPASYRHIFGSLARCVFRALHPELPLHRYPHGFCRAMTPPSLRMPLASAEEALHLITESALGRFERLFTMLDAIPAPGSPHLGEYWSEERKRLEDYGRKAASRGAENG